MPGVRTRPKPPGTSLGKSRSHAPRRRVATSLFNGVRPSTTRRGQGERHCLIKQRERTDCPQLTDVPSDLRVNGARHASRDLMPPSKPISPPQGESLHRTLLRCVPLLYKTGGPNAALHGGPTRHPNSGGQSQEPKAKSPNPRAESRKPRAQNREPRAKSRNPRAASREPKAESREPSALS